MSTATVGRKRSNPVTKKYKVEIDERTLAMSDEALECRDSNHAWSKLPADPARRSQLFRDGMYERIRECTRCTTKRIDVYTIRTGELVSRRYDYADDYLITEKGSGYLYVSEIRKAQFARENPDLIG